jgi:hypothetical protein
VVTSASPLQAAARETRDALEVIGRGEQLLAEPWRRQLRASQDRVEQLVGAQSDSWNLRSGRVQSDCSTLRAARALAATAASESALAVQFEARLLKLSGEQLQAVSDGLEASFAAARGHRAEAAAHLESATEDSLAKLRADLGLGGAAGIGNRTIRFRERFADAVTAAMRVYADRIGQLLLDVGEAAHAAVGAPSGGLLPTWESRVPPRPDLPQSWSDDAAELVDELSRSVGRSVDPFRERLTDQVEEAIETLRARIDRAARCHEPGERAVRDGADELGRIARCVGQLAEALDWMLLDDR